MRAVFGYFTDTVVGGAIEMQGYRAELEMFTGGADEAADTLARLRKNTIDPLFGTENLVNAYKDLRTVGMEAKAAEGMVTVLGDMANGSVENFNMLSGVLQRTSATGKFSTGGGPTPAGGGARKVNDMILTPEQAQTAVQRAMQDALKGAINSSRGNIPAPEARRRTGLPSPAFPRRTRGRGSGWPTRNCCG
jgi:hypothetical protein